MSEILIHSGTIVNDRECFVGYIRVSGERIVEVGRGEFVGDFSGQRISAKGRIVMPGVIDDQVHFREPGMTYKGDIHNGSLAGVAGGVTSYMEMPNTVPPTTTIELLEQKQELASRSSVANYSFYFGATNDNIQEIKKIDPRTTCGVKVFMGSSTGNMLVDDPNVLAAIFAESPRLIATHCEKESIIQANIDYYKKKFGDKATAQMHPLIRSTEACYQSTAQAVGLADRYGSNLHVLHLSSARELDLFDAKPLLEKKITNEVCVHHLWFCDEDYPLLGNLIKWNPSIKTVGDRDALRAGLLSGKVDVVATDHAPHTLEEKERPYWAAPSGGPMLQHSLVAMLELSRRGILTVEKLVEKMCHAPANRFGVVERGYLREGYFADIVIVDPDSRWVVTEGNVLYKCAWSPMLGVAFSHKVLYTIVNGTIVYEKGEIKEDFRGRLLEFQ